MTSQELWELHAICASGDSDLLQETIGSGKLDHLIDYKDAEWRERTPLHWCCIRGRGDMVRILLERGAHPGLRTSSGWTPVHYAAECGRAHILRTLHQYNAPMDRRDISGDTPRDVALVYGHKEAAEFLATAEADYAARRRKLELSGQATQFDDEDLDWCRSNDVMPDAYVTAAELKEISRKDPALIMMTSSSSSSKRKLLRSHSNKPDAAAADAVSSAGSKKRLPVVKDCCRKGK